MQVLWDLIRRSHVPYLAQNVSPLSLTTISAFPISSKPALSLVGPAVMTCMYVDKQLMLGVGDLGGTLHILEVPWSLRHPSSHEVYAYFLWIQWCISISHSTCVRTYLYYQVYLPYYANALCLISPLCLPSLPCLCSQLHLHMWPGLQKSTMWVITPSYIFANISCSECAIPFP